MSLHGSLLLFVALFCVSAHHSALATYPQQPPYPARPNPQPTPPRQNPQPQYPQPTPPRQNVQPYPQPPYPARPNPPATPPRQNPQPQPPYPARPNPQPAPQQPAPKPQSPQNPPIRNNQPTPQTTTTARTTLHPWASICPNINANLNAKGKLSVKELNTVFVPALADFVRNGAGKTASDMATLQLPLNLTRTDEVKAFWSKFDAAHSKITDARRKMACYAMEELIRINSNGGQVDGASTNASAKGTPFNVTFTYNCTQFRDTALLLLTTNVTDDEGATAIQNAYVNDSKCFGQRIEEFAAGLAAFTFDNMSAAEVKSNIEVLKRLVEPFQINNPVGDAVKLAMTAASALFDLSRLYE